MRFVVAIVSFVIAFFMIGIGIAQRTVFSEPDRVTSSLELGSAAPITIIDGDTLNARDGRQKIEIAGTRADTIFAAYGRTLDVIAWAGDTTYNHIGYDDESGELTDELESGSTDEAPSASGSDLWLGEYTREDALEFTVNVPEDISVIIMSDGVEPAPSEVKVTWPLDNRTPWSGPLIVGGVLFLLLGLGLYLWALAHLRKTRGPRRKPPKQPRLPKNPRYNYRKATKAVRQSKPKAIENPRGRRSAGRMTAVLPVMLISAVVLSGCSADAWPDFLGGTAESTPSPLATTVADDAEIQQAPAVTVPQLEGIMTRIAGVATQADADRDPALAETRFTGAALELRQSNYAIRTVDNSIAALPAIAAGPVELTLPQQSDSWPRSVFTVIQDPSDETVIPTAFMLVQASPRDNFKIAYSVALEAKVELPQVASANVGAVRFSPDFKLPKLPPGEVVTAYADIMALGEASAYFEMFDLEEDVLIPKIGVDAKAARKAEVSTVEFSYARTPGIGETIALASNESGALVTVNVDETENAKPTEAGSMLNPTGLVKVLSGLASTTKGVSATYSYQLLFYVPPATSTDKIRLLGFSEGLVAAKEL